MSAAMPELGSKISLISKADIRYEGRLFTVDPQECTIALANVRSFGTEDRETQYIVAPQSQVYDYILFRGSDIKDIRVVNNVGPLPNDPAIVQLSVPPSLSQSNYQSPGFSHPVLGHMGPMSQYPTYGQMGGLGGLPGSMAPGMGLHRDSRTLSKQQTSVLDLIGSSRSTTPSLISRKSPTMDQGVQVSAPGSSINKDEKKHTRPIQPPGQSREGQSRDSQYRTQTSRESQVRSQRNDRDFQKDRDKDSGWISKDNDRNEDDWDPNHKTSEGWNSDISQDHKSRRDQNFKQQRDNRDRNYPRDTRDRRENQPMYQRDQRLMHPRDQGLHMMNALPQRFPPQQQRGGWINRGNMRRGRGRGMNMPPIFNRIPGQQISPRPKNTLKFDNDYDFEQANTKFEELRSQLAKTKISDTEITSVSADSKTTNSDDKKDDSGNETGVGEGEPEEEPEVFYDKSKSFFDNISCEAVERSKGRSQRTDWRTERKLNSETFGVSSARRGAFRGRFYGNRMYNNAYRGGSYRGQGIPRGGRSDLGSSSMPTVSTTQDK